ncbi:MAG: tetratricopeptide repeat protein [Pseudomonadota bacterium]
MSLINQVLTQLEQRGVQGAPHQTLLRAVPVRVERNWIKIFLIVCTTALLFMVATLLWIKFQTQGKESTVSGSTANSAQTPASVPVQTAENTAVQQAPAAKMSLELEVTPLLPKPLRTHVEVPFAQAQAKVNVPAKPEVPSQVQKEDKTLSSKVATVAEEPLKIVSSTQRADAEYRKAFTLQKQGNHTEALAGYAAALNIEPQLDVARMSMAALLVENKRIAEAERVLQEGLVLKPAQIEFSMFLARVQVERGASAEALATLQANLQLADDRAEYQAFYAALLQREGRHVEALKNFQNALRIVPQSGIWLMGYGISLQALARNEEAKKVFQQAVETQTLSPELTAFVQQKLSNP